MSPQECKRKHTSTEFTVWCAYFEKQVNDFHREDFFMAQICQTLSQCFSSSQEEADKILLERFLLKFKQEGSAGTFKPEPAPTPIVSEQQVQTPAPPAIRQAGELGKELSDEEWEKKVKASKSQWAGFVGLNLKTGKIRDSHRIGSPGRKTIPGSQPVGSGKKKGPRRLRRDGLKDGADGKGDRG